MRINNINNFVRFKSNEIVYAKRVKTDDGFEDVYFDKDAYMNRVQDTLSIAEQNYKHILEQESKRDELIKQQELKRLQDWEASIRRPGKFQKDA